MCFSDPPPPVQQPQLASLEQPDSDPQVRAAENTIVRRRAAAGGKSKNILTSPQGLTEEANLGVKTLLGA